MKFVAFNLGARKKNEVVEVTLSSRAYVRLIDDDNFSLYKTGGKYSFFGGIVRFSPYHIAIPRDGNWHIAVDMGDKSGKIAMKITATAKVLRR
ncbi:MAG: DUF1883 domain-containing protein [Synergistaceae bacterium]|nr:DUF1883 domain-containing protein [Synergistaceae bacterium]